jgi:hypothetical protein
MSQNRKRHSAIGDSAINRCCAPDNVNRVITRQHHQFHIGKVSDDFGTHNASLASTAIALLLITGSVFAQTETRKPCLQAT